MGLKIIKRDYCVQLIAGVKSCLKSVYLKDTVKGKREEEK